MVAQDAHHLYSKFTILFIARELTKIQFCSGRKPKSTLPYRSFYFHWDQFHKRRVVQCVRRGVRAKNNSPKIDANLHGCILLYVWLCRMIFDCLVVIVVVRYLLRFLYYTQISTKIWNQKKGIQVWQSESWMEWMYAMRQDITFVWRVSM